MICSLSLQIWSKRSFGLGQWTKTDVEYFTPLLSLLSKDVEWRQRLISWQILDWLQLRSRRMRMLGKKQETFKQLHQEKQHTKRARKSAGQNIRDLNRKAATVLWKICAPTLISSFKFQTSTHVCLFFILKAKMECMEEHTPQWSQILKKFWQKMVEKHSRRSVFFSGLVILNETQGDRESFISTVYLLL